MYLQSRDGPKLFLSILFLVIFLIFEMNIF